MSGTPLPRYDIFISGAGPAGLIAAAAFGAAGYSVLLTDPAPPITDARAPGADHRSTAFLRPARALFERAGIWEHLAPYAVPLNALRIVDTRGEPPQLHAERTFQATDSGASTFGWNFLNWMIRRELLAALEGMDSVTLRLGTGFRAILSRIDEARITLEDGSALKARLAIGADGRDSPMRNALGIGTRIIRYGQKSLAFCATHEIPHEHVSTEIYHRGGPFTMVPLADIEGRPASAIVWMNPGPRAVELGNMPAAQFNAEMTRRSAGLFGPLTLSSPRGIFPIISQTAERLSAGRAVILAEAAHVLPPIGAQGLNTSLNDIALLLDLIRTAPEDPGKPEILKEWEQRRLRDIASRSRAIDLFNRVIRSPNPAALALRQAGLMAAHDIAPLRKKLMRFGLGPRPAQ